MLYRADSLLLRANQFDKEQSFAATVAAWEQKKAASRGSGPQESEESGKEANENKHGEERPESEKMKMLSDEMVRDHGQRRKELVAQEDWAWYELEQDEEKQRKELEQESGHEDGWDCSCGKHCGEKEKSCQCGEGRRNMRGRPSGPAEKNLEPHPWQAGTIAEAQYWYASHHVVPFALLLYNIALQPLTQE